MKQMILPILIGITVGILAITIINTSCAPTGKGGDYCERLKIDKQHVLEFYEDGYEKTQLLEVLDSLINKTCDYERSIKKE